MRVAVLGVQVAIDGATIVSDASVEVASGEVHGLIGPNGSGKSTLLRCLYRALRPALGKVLLGDDDLWADLSGREAARRRAVVTQDSVIELDFTVRDVVAMGRTPHTGWLGRADDGDRTIVDDALAAVGMQWAALRHVATLSGGERQRVHLARAIAQRAPVLLLDEPTNHLDVSAQLELLELIRALGLTTVVALHDLDHAASFCDRVTVMRRGVAVASGRAADVLTPSTIADVFGVRTHVGTHPLTGRLHLTFAPLAPPSTPSDPLSPLTLEDPP